MINSHEQPCSVQRSAVLFTNVIAGANAKIDVKRDGKVNEIQTTDRATSDDIREPKKNRLASAAASSSAFFFFLLHFHECATIAEIMNETRGEPGNVTTKQNAEEETNWKKSESLEVGRCRKHGEHIDSARCALAIKRKKRREQRKKKKKNT